MAGELAGNRPGRTSAVSAWFSRLGRPSRTPEFPALKISPPEASVCSPALPHVAPPHRRPHARSHPQLPAASIPRSPSPPRWRSHVMPLKDRQKGVARGKRRRGILIKQERGVLEWETPVAGNIPSRELGPLAAAIVADCGMTACAGRARS